MESPGTKAKVLLFKTSFCCTYYHWSGETPVPTVQHQRLSLGAGLVTEVILPLASLFSVWGTRFLVPCQSFLLWPLKTLSGGMWCYMKWSGSAKPPMKCFPCELHQSDILCVSHTYIPLGSNTERGRKDTLYTGTLEMLPSLFCTTGLSI